MVERHFPLHRDLIRRHLAFEEIRQFLDILQFHEGKRIDRIVSCRQKKLCGIVAHDKLEVAFVGKNLANEAANLGDNRSIAAETPGRPRLIVNQPRTIGLEFRESF